MALHRSAVRQHRRSVRRAAVNKQNKSAVRSEVRKVRELARSQKTDEAKKSLAALQSIIDKAIKKGAIHRNKGARLKSRLSRQVGPVSPAPSK